MTRAGIRIFWSPNNDLGGPYFIFHGGCCPFMLQLYIISYTYLVNNNPCEGYAGLNPALNDD